MTRVRLLTKRVDLAALHREIAAQSATFTGLRASTWDIGDTLYIDGADDLTDAQVDAILAAHVPPTPEYPDAMRQSLGGIFAGTAAQKVARMVDAVERYPALGTALHMLGGQPPFTAERRAFVREVATRLRAKIGTANEALTQTEYDTLKALAVSRGLPGLIP